MIYKKEDILEDRVFKDFLRSRGIRDTTKKLYEQRIRHFCNFVEKIPSELIEEADEEQDKGIKLRNRKVKEYILDYIDAEKENGKASSSIKSYLETIRAMYYENDIDLPRLKNIFRNNNNNPALEELPTKEHYRTAIKHCTNLRDKSILLLQFSSGMGAAEIRNLNYGQFYNAINEFLNIHESEKFEINKIKHQLKDTDNLIGTWHIIRYKTGMPYITFNSPESMYAIIDYLIDRNTTNPITSLEDPLFISNGKQIEEHAFAAIYRRINQRAGFGKRSENREFLTSHIPRKMFATTMYENDVEFISVEWMLGHKIDSTKAAYFKNNVEKLKEHYLDGLEGLTMEKVKVKKVSTPEYDSLINKLGDRDEEVEGLKEQLNKQNDQFMVLNNHFNAIENINMLISEIDIEIADANSIGDTEKRRELSIQKGKLNNERIEIMAERNPKFAQLYKEKKIKTVTNRLNYFRSQLEQASREKERERYQLKVSEFEAKLKKIIYP